MNYSCDIYQDPATQLSNVKFDATFKLILIGNSGVGKTCIIKRIGHNSFSEEHEVTIGAEFTTIAAHLNKKSFIKMQFWDSCGQERFNSITRIFYRGSHCVLLCYEVTKQFILNIDKSYSIQTLRDLESLWISDVKNSLRDSILILVGNKADIDEVNSQKSKRQVTIEEAHKFKAKHNLDYFTEVSAKSSKGIKELVEYISKALYNSHKDNLYEYKESEGSSVSYKSRRSSSQSQNSGNNTRSPYQMTTGSTPISNSSARNQNKGKRNSSHKLKKQMDVNSGVHKKNSCC